MIASPVAVFSKFSFREVVMRVMDKLGRRLLPFLRIISFAAAGLVLVAQPAASQTVADAPARSLKIGIIGSGKMGGALGELWAKAGHEVLFSSRHPEELKDLVKRVGSRSRAGTPQEAVAFGEVIFVAVPYAALPQIGRDLAGQLAGKIVLDACNPVPQRDGPMAEEALAKGTGVASAEYLPGARLVRAFNAINYNVLVSEAHRAGERLGIPIAGADRDALAIASRLVADAGFDPVVVGPLARAKDFDRGSAVYVKVLTARELRQRLGLDPAPKP